MESESSDSPRRDAQHAREDRRKLFGFFVRYRWAFLVGMVCLLGTNLLALTIPWLLRGAVDTLALPEPDLKAVGRYALGIGGVAVLQGVIRIASRVLIFNSGRNVEYDLRGELFAHLTRLPPTWYQRRTVGDLMSRLTNDLMRVRALLGPGILNVVNTSVAYVGSLTMMLVIDPWLCLVAVVPFPLLLLLSGRFVGNIYRYSRAAQEELGRLQARVQENLAGISVLRAYGATGRETEAFAEHNKRYLQRNMRLALSRGLLPTIAGTATGIAVLVVLFVGGRRVVDGHISLGDFVAFVGYLTALTWPTMALGWILSLWQTGMSGMSRLNEVLREPVIDEGPAADSESLAGAIGAHALGYGYESDSDARALSDINLDIGAGEFVCIVGPTGSGKSTLLSLIARLLPAEPGQLSFDGQDAHAVSLPWLRRQIGVVPQQSFLFSATVAENIAFGVPDAPRERVEDFARLAALSDDLQALPRGLETVVGEKGVTLSGGQRQRVALARALTYEPRILLLDDSLSAVDVETEERILDALLGRSPRSTLMLATHRLTAAERADRIFVLDEGRLVEQGTHTELAAAGGLYAELLERQRMQEALQEVSRAPIPDAVQGVPA